MMKLLARCAFLLVTVLWGSFYAVAKGALAHTDPIIFTFFEALTLVPIALSLLIMQRKTLTLAVLKRGILLGSCLCIATLTITVSETVTAATTTAFFPSTGGIFAAIIMATVFRRSLGTSVWVACGLSLVGILLIFRGSLSTAELRGDVIALIGALLFTVYLFLVEQDAQYKDQPFWALLGIEHLSMALWMTLFSLLFGDWQHFHPMLAHDIPVVLYVALACTFLPVILTHVAHRSLDPLETSFISILEPLWGVIIAHLYLGEVVPFSLYIGGGLIITGAFVHQTATGDLVAFCQTLNVMLHQGISSVIKTLKSGVHRGIITVLTMSGTNIFLLMRVKASHDIYRYPEQRDSHWKECLMSLLYSLLGAVRSLSKAIRFQHVSSQGTQQLYHLLDAVSLLHGFFLNTLRSSSKDTHMLVLLFCNDWHSGARKQWYLHHVLWCRSCSKSSEYSSLFAGSQHLRRWQLSYRCLQELLFQYIWFPHHVHWQITRNWCTAPPGK